MSVAESFRQAKQELKRADHSIAVSLKYTRTVDVIKSIIERLINSLSYALTALLEKAKNEKKIPEVPNLPRLKVEQVRDLYKDDPQVLDMCNFFLLLRKIDKARYGRSQEFRRNVTMTVYLDDGSTIEITIDIITDYYGRTQECISHVGTVVVGDE